MDTSQKFKKESMCRVMQIPRSCLKHYPRGYVKKLVSQCQFLAFIFSVKSLAKNANYLQQNTNILFLEAGPILDIQIQNIE